MGRPPRAVIADALYENVAHGLTWEQWADKADDVLAALRDEYGAWGPDADSLTRWAPIIPVPVEATDG